MLPKLGRLNGQPWRPLIALALALVLAPALAWAHAMMIRSEPSDGAVLDQPPKIVTAWFDMELEEEGSTLAVFNGNGQRVDDGKGQLNLNDPDHASMIVSLPQALRSGKYTVRWQATSAAGEHAGHVTDGEFSFEIR